MKKRLFFMGVVGLLAVSIPGCRQDVNQPPPPPEATLDAAVVRAQRFLESKVGPPALPNTYYKAGVTLSQTRAGETAPMLGDAIVPDWPEAQTWEYEGDIVTEVPAILTRPVTYTTAGRHRQPHLTAAPHPYQGHRMSRHGGDVLLRYHSVARRIVCRGSLSTRLQPCRQRLFGYRRLLQSRRHAGLGLSLCGGRDHRLHAVRSRGLSGQPRSPYRYGYRRWAGHKGV